MSGSSSQSPNGLGAMQASMTGRMPRAPANLLVQLPPDELRRMATQRGSMAKQSMAILAHQQAQSGPSRGPSHAAAAAPVQPSDVTLLAASIQERRERDAKVFMWQQRLIAGDASLERSTLKRALTQLSLPAWLQVLEERHLAGRCAYPTCTRRPKRPHLSQQANPALPLDAPRFRISLRRQTIERDERDDAGGQNAFCSNGCWRRGEWVSRWVLNEGRSTRQVQRQVSDETFGSGLRDPYGLGNEVDQGGRWERRMDEEHWTEVELLEDLEDRGEVDRLSDDEKDPDKGVAQSPRLGHRPSTATLSPVTGAAQATAKESSPSRNQDPRDLLQGQPDQVARQHVQRRAHAKGTDAAFLDLVDSLTVHEKHAGAPETVSADIAETNGKEADERGHIDARSTALPGQIDDEGDTSMGDETASEDGEHVDPEEQTRRRTLQRQKRQQQQEEDDLFALAWQAMDEEKARGTWEE